MRKISDEELPEMIENLRNFLDLKKFTKYALDFYGNNSHKLDITVSYVFNDEGGTYTNIDYITVFDAEGKELQPDLNLPRWQEHIEQHKLYTKDPHTLKYYNDNNLNTSFNEDDINNVLSEAIHDDLPEVSEDCIIIIDP